MYLDGRETLYALLCTKFLVCFPVAIDRVGGYERVQPQGGLLVLWRHLLTVLDDPIVSQADRRNVIEDVRHTTEQ